MDKKTLLKKLRQYLKIAALSTAASYSAPAVANRADSETLSNPAEKTILMPDAANLAKNTSHLAFRTIYKFDELPQISAMESTLNHHLTYVADAKTWRQSGEISLKRVDSRYLITEDMTSVMQKREGDGCAVNVNPTQTRILICQANVTIAQNFIRSLYCSNIPQLHEFAAKYIKKTPQNDKLLEEIQQLLYTPKGTLKIGDDGIKDRIKAIAKMNAFTVIGMNTGKRFNNAFIRDLEALDRKAHDVLLQAEKDFSVAFYPLTNAQNIPARKAEAFARKNHWRDASCIPVGTAGLYLSSLIAGGAYSNITLTNERSTMQNVNNANKADYITLEYAYQMAIAGYNGADKLYKEFQKAVLNDRKQLIRISEEMLTPDFTLPTDAIKEPRSKVLPLNHWLKERRSER